MKSENLVESLLSFTRLLRPARYPDMTPEQHWLLRHLKKAGPLKIGELAQALKITTGSATVACKRLETAGLVTRQRGVEDKNGVKDERVVIVALTEQGHARIDAVRQQKREALAGLLDTVLDPQEQQSLQSMIERLLDAAETQGFGEEKKHDSNH
jgi:DNA-binding MarR family transcriptional regulator